MGPVSAWRRYAVTLGLGGFTVACWAAVIITDMLNAPEHMWTAFLILANSATTGTLLSVVIVQLADMRRELAGAYAAMAENFVSRRPDPSTGPLPALRAVPGQLTAPPASQAPSGA